MSLSIGLVSLVVVQPAPVQADDGITLTDLPIVNSRASALNDIGQVVGTGFNSPQHGFLWDAGVTTPLATDGASDVNASGQVVGYRLDNPKGGNPIPVMWENGVVTDLGGIGVASAINEAGQIVGNRFGLMPDGRPSPVLWQDGAVVDLPTPFEGLGGWATGVNELGQIAGNALTTLDEGHAVLWTDGVPTDLGPGEAAAINDLGQVVGSRFESDAVGNTVYFALLWDHGTVVTLGSGVALGINNAGQIVGYRVVGPGSQWVPVMWEDGVETVLPAPDTSVTTFASDINDAGQAVGTETDSSGHLHALLWTLEGPETAIPIDVKPGSHTNRINPKGKGVVAVGLLSTDGFDARTVRVDTVCFGDAEDAGRHGLHSATHGSPSRPRW